ncbi:MAG: cadherin repeat domain-containing protein, partial [Campylobacterota bacterium]|nr:cadherin repeat domain-containing protein [Campylobacterota bacterium]
DTISPSITSNSTISIAEGNTTAIDIDATDTNTLTYSLTSTDASAFDINSTNGIVTFKVAPTDYEYPSDQNEDNNYIITANVSDGVNNSTQNITIAVTNVADTAPTLTALTTSIIESASNGDVAGNIVIDTGDTAISAFVLKE